VGLQIKLLEGCRRIQAQFIIQIWTRENLNTKGRKIKEDELKFDTTGNFAKKSMCFNEKSDDVTIFIKIKKWIKN